MIPVYCLNSWKLYWCCRSFLLLVCIQLDRYCVLTNIPNDCEKAKITAPPTKKNEFTIIAFLLPK